MHRGKTINSSNFGVSGVLTKGSAAKLRSSKVKASLCERVVNPSFSRTNFTRKETCMAKLISKQTGNTLIQRQL